MILQIAEDKHVVISNGAKEKKAKATEVGLGWRISPTTGKPEFDIRHRGVKLMTVNETFLHSHFNGLYKSVHDAFEKTEHTLAKAVSKK